MVIVGVTLLLIAGVVTAATLIIGGDDGGGAGPPRTVAEAPILQPVLVPRRRRPPQVVEPVAGETADAQVAEARARALPAIDAGPAPPPPSDAEIKAELAQLKNVERRYDFAQLDFRSKLLGADQIPGAGWHQSIASFYDDYGGPLACGGTLKPDQLGVAHKSLRCGTVVTFRYGNRAIRVPVIDRGPYITGREWDFTGATAAALKFPGLGIVQWTLDG